MKYEILFNDRHTEIVDHETMENLVYELESFERDDVSQIHEYDESKPDEVGKTIWTEEEGLFVSYGELESSSDLPEDIQDKLIDRFWDGLKGWDYDSWMSSGSSDKESIVTDILPEFEGIDEESIYDLFYEWASGLEEDSFSDPDEDDEEDEEDDET
jgi:hypothetical protein